MLSTELLCPPDQHAASGCVPVCVWVGVCQRSKVIKWNPPASGCVCVCGGGGGGGGGGQRRSDMITCTA